MELEADSQLPPSKFPSFDKEVSAGSHFDPTVTDYLNRKKIHCIHCKEVKSLGINW